MHMVRFIKVFAALLIAFLILNIFTLGYYNVPPSYEDPDNVTDCKRVSHYLWARGTEWYGYGKTNNDGYMNQFDWESGDPIDILIIGSSHMEGLGVPMHLSTASRLNEYLPNDTVYNIGVSAHDLLICIGNLENAIAKYHPNEYVIIETSNLEYSDEEMYAAINDEFPQIPASNKKWVMLLKSIPYIRLVASQSKEASNLWQDTVVAKEVSEVNNKNNYNTEKLWDLLLKKTHEIMEPSGAKLIILYHPSVRVEKDGSLTIDGEEAEKKCFRELCEQNDILFLDMSDRFLSEYEKDYTLPNGFANTSVGTGHLNRYGHEMIAEELYKLIGGDD